jgi:hypothetical protein
MKLTIKIKLTKKEIKNPSVYDNIRRKSRAAVKELWNHHLAGYLFQQPKKTRSKN